MTVFFTILAGVSVFVIGQIIMRFAIDPVIKFKETVGEINHCIIYYSNRYGTCPHIPTQQDDIVITEAKNETRLLASRLTATYTAIPFKEFWIRCNVIPSNKDMLAARTSLVALSNSVWQRIADHMIGNIEIIENKLAIQTGLTFSDGE